MARGYSIRRLAREWVPRRREFTAACHGLPARPVSSHPEQLAPGRLDLLGRPALAARRAWSGPGGGQVPAGRRLISASGACGTSPHRGWSRRPGKQPPFAGSRPTGPGGTAWQYALSKRRSWLWISSEMSASPGSHLDSSNALPSATLIGVPGAVHMPRIATYV